MDLNPIITKRANGEYSTVIIDNYVETMWFGDDGEMRLVNRTKVMDKITISENHIEEFEKG